MSTVEKDIKETNDKIAEVKAIVKKRAKAIKLFDKGLITFTDDKRMVISNWISPSNVRRMNLENMKYYPKMPIDDMRIKYLDYHRSCVFKG